MNNQKIRGYAIRGWNYISHKTVQALQHYCDFENGFADCFEENIEPKPEYDVKQFFASHDNYWKRKKTSTKWTYTATTTCGATDQKLDLAQGLVCS